MTPRTRTSNKDANYKVYYSKKIPQQARFPYREKTVRRPNPIEQDGVDKRQMKFLPEKMRQQPALEQNESEEVETEEEPVVQEAITPKNAKSTPVNERKGKKRKSSNVQEDSDSGNKPAISSSKRRRRTAALRDQPSRTLRRQSTMTQLADGRRPSLDNDEPEFRPAKRRSRASRGAERETDRRQRTLTQMIPGMGWLSKEELEELSDLDADLDHVQTYKDADSLPLVEQGLPGVRQTTASTESTQRSGEAKQNQDSLPLATHLQSSLALHSVEISAEEKEDDDEDDYQPTQFIEAPTLRTRQTPRRLAAQEPSSNASGPEKSERSRFRLLSTPEKRRVLEIPSSQSPAESVLSTQISPQKTQRSTLRERNNVVVVAETPSKRRQVTFRQPTVQPAPPVHLSKFDSTIQDSEDEGSELEDDLSTQQPSGGSQLNWSGQAIGADTQSLLLQIDRACAVDDESLNVVDRNTSDEPNESITRPAPYQPSPELGESWAPVIYDDDGPQYESYRSSRASGNLQSLRAIDPSPVLYQLDNASQMNLTTQAPMLADDIPSTPPMIQPPPGEDLSSTPMVLRDESSDEENSDSEPTPPRTIERHILEPPSTLIHQSTDLDGEPVQALRFPSTEHETQQSHSSKAEQQLQNEWLSYSQYVHTGAPNSSSMHVTANASSLNATPRNLNPGHFTASSSRIQHSQATTVDELTPKKNRTQRLFSTNTTPHRTGKAEPFVSPEKPPSLFIPSSFPSPSRAPLEGWSSPVLARTQNMYGSSQVLESLEDFSIPLPPPIADD